MTPDTTSAGSPRPEKVAVVEEVRERIGGTSATILTDYRGLSVSKLADLRIALRAAGGDFKVYKNTLVRFAARDLGIGIEELLVGPTALAFVTDKPDGTPGDAVDVAKALKDFGRDHPELVLKGGILGDRLLSADDTQALADVQPRDVLLTRLAGGMAAPMQRFASLLQALPRNFAYGLMALIDQQGGAPAAEASEPSASEAVSDDADATTDTQTNDQPTDSEAAAEPSEPSASEAVDDDVESRSVPTGTDEERAGTPDDEDEPNETES